MCGVAFGEGVGLISRVTQGCQPITPMREITTVQGNVILGLNAEPALDVLLRGSRRVARAARTPITDCP